MEIKNVKNIIVVDDDRSIRVVISTALSRAGYNVKSSGTAAGMWRLVETDFADIANEFNHLLGESSRTIQEEGQIPRGNYGLELNQDRPNNEIAVGMQPVTRSSVIITRT